MCVKCVLMYVNLCECVYMCVNVCKCVWMCVNLCECVWMCVSVVCKLYALPVPCQARFPLRPFGRYVGPKLAQVGLMLAPCWLMLAPCWLMLASCWPHVEPSWPQDASKWLQVGSSWLQDAKNGLQELPRASKMTQNGSKMAPKLICLMTFFHILSIFKNIKKTKENQWFFNISHPLNVLFLTLSWYNFGSILCYVALCASRCLQIASSLPQDGPLEWFLVQLDAKLAPRCLKLVPLWAQVGSKLAHVEAKLAQNPLLNGPGGSHRRSWESPGRFPGSPRSQEALQEASGVQNWPPRASKMTQNGPKNVKF